MDFHNNIFSIFNRYSITLQRKYKFCSAERTMISLVPFQTYFCYQQYLQSSTIADQMHGMHSDEDGVALSGNWRYQRHSQTWSRMADVRRAPQPLQPARPPYRSLQLQRPEQPQLQQQQQQSLQPQQLQRNSLLQRSHSERIKVRNSIARTWE